MPILCCAPMPLLSEIQKFGDMCPLAQWRRRLWRKVVIYTVFSNTGSILAVSKRGTVSLLSVTIKVTETHAYRNFVICGDCDLDSRIRI